ncbi:MAG TPA: hypothetical protein VMZ26_13435 [Pyrinomonadaceae bacterium]|nr:hypothetical protein [Pyrinomonadaceae bacterium]
MGLQETQTEGNSNDSGEETSHTEETQLMGGLPDTLGADPSVDEAQAEEAEGSGESAAESSDDDSAPVAPKTPRAPLFKGLTKSFETPEELASYASELERKVIEHEAKLGVFERVTPKAEVEKASAPEKKASYAERLFADPDGVIAEIRADIKREIQEESSKSETEKTFWKSFYDENTDLRGLEEVVGIKLEQNRQAWSALSLNDAKVALATEVRKFVTKVRDSGKPTDALPNGKAHALPASSGSVPRVPATEKKPQTFAEQIKSLRSRGKKVS